MSYLLLYLYLSGPPSNAYCLQTSKYAMKYFHGLHHTVFRVDVLSPQMQEQFLKAGAVFILIVDFLWDLAQDWYRVGTQARGVSQADNGGRRNLQVRKFGLLDW